MPTSSTNTPMTSLERWATAATTTGSDRKPFFCMMSWNICWAESFTPDSRWNRVFAAWTRPPDHSVLHPRRVLFSSSITG
jgi:hypothetical protein